MQAMMEEEQEEEQEQEEEGMYRKSSLWATTAQSTSSPCQSRRT